MSNWVYHGAVPYSLIGDWRPRWGILLTCWLVVGTVLSARAAGTEEALFFDARADQTASPNGGSAIWSLTAGTWRWWSTNVKHANVSPDGTQVAYITNANLVVSALDGRNPKILSAQATFPVWSPRGDRIAYIFGRDTLQIIDREGVVVKSYPGTTVARVSWSPDGARIAYNGSVNVDEVGCELFETLSSPCPRQVSMSTVLVLDVETGTKTPLFTPTWVSTAGPPWTDARGVRWTPVTTIQTHLLAPQWSPDGTRIAGDLRILRRDIRSNPADGLTDNRLGGTEFNIVVIPAGGGSLTRVTTDVNPSPFKPENLHQNMGAVWSADGRLFYTKYRGTSSPAVEQGMYEVPSNLGPGRQINSFVAGVGSLQWARLAGDGVELAISLPSPLLRKGQRAAAKVRVTSGVDGPQTVRFVSRLLGSGDDAVVKVESVTAPAPFTLTARDASQEFEVPVRAVDLGKTDLIAQIEVTDATGTVRPITARRSVEVVFGGDLLIKRDAEPATAFAGEDVYQRVPAGEQVRTNVTARNQTSLFQVRIQNDDQVPRTYLLSVVESGTQGWQAGHFLGPQDITASVRSFPGFQFPRLATNQSYNVIVRLTPTNAPSDPIQRAVWVLSSTNDPALTLDSVETVSMLPEVDVLAIEVTQSVQDWRNSVPLVAGKRTLVRVFLALPEGSEFEGEASVGLRGYRDGVELKESPIASRKPTIPVHRVIDSSDRRFLENTVCFDLPGDWTRGELRLEMEALDFSPRYQEPAEPGGTPKDGVVKLRFNEVPALPVVFHRVVERLPSGKAVQAQSADVVRTVRRFEAMLPISKVEWRMGFSPVVESREILKVEDLDKINALMKADAGYLRCRSLAGCELHQALVPVLDAPKEDGGGLQGGGSADDIPSQVSTAQLSITYRQGMSTPVHELAHCLGRSHPVLAANGVFHSPDGELYHKGFCSEFADADVPDFPYFYRLSQGAGPSLGPLNGGEDLVVYGYDAENNVAMDAKTTYELMSYCGDEQWTSKPTYEALMEAIRTRWGVPSPSRLQTLDREVRQMVLRGSIDLKAGTARLLPVRTLLTAESSLMPGPGPYRLEVLDDAEKVIVAHDFTIARDPDDAEGASFFFVIPQPDEFRGLRLKRGPTVLLSLRASEREPTVRVVSPNGGEVLDQEEVTVRWEAEDVDGDALRYTVEYNPDGGAHWETLAVDLGEKECVVPRNLLAGSAGGRVRVHASDGLRAVTDLSDAPFRVTDNPPELFILEPSGNYFVSGKQRVYFSAAYLDPEEGSGGGARIQWSSDRDGALGVGLSLERLASELSAGEHEIRAMASDNAGHSVTATTRLSVLKHFPARLSAPRAIQGAQLEFDLLGATGTTNHLESSVDLLTWSPLATQVMRSYRETVRVPVPTAGRPIFIRAVTE